MNKTVLITGAVKNSGLGIARKFQSEGLGHTCRANAFGYLSSMLKAIELQVDNCPAK